MKIPGVLVKNRFLSPAVCSTLRKIYDQFYMKGSQNDYTMNKVLHLFDLRRGGHVNEHAFMLRCIKRVHEKVMAWADQGKPIYVEAAFLARLPEGGRHPKHCDNCKEDGTPNHTPHRDYSSLVYLNSDFTGGEICFLGRGILKPTAGTLVAFPSGGDYPHEVPPVVSGKRYSMPIWFSFNPQKNIFR